MTRLYSLGHGFVKKATAIILSMVMLITGMMFLVPTEADAYMWPTKSQSNMNIKTYTLSGGNITAYTSSSLSSKKGTIYASDLITINRVSGNAVEVTYPTSRGSKTGWVSASQLSKGKVVEGYSLAMKAGAKVTVYRKETGSATIGSISKNDTVYLVYAGADHTNGRAQFIYPVSGGWKMGWVNFSDIDRARFRAVGGGRTINNGWYRIRVSGTHSLDSEGPDWNVHVWENLNVSQQNVYIKHLGNGVYSVKLHNGKYLDQQGGIMDPSTLWGYEWNDSTAQHWYIADLGDGKYGFFNQGSGLSMDVYCYQTQRNGADIMAYYYNGQHVTLERTDGNKQVSAYSSSSNNNNSNNNNNNNKGTLINVISTNTWQYPLGASSYVCGNDWSTYYKPKAKEGRPDHVGLDMASKEHNTIMAAAKGTVEYSGYNGANGNYVIISHTLSGKTVYSIYGHLHSYNVKRGDKVEAGTQIGTISTDKSGQGSSSTGMHVHFAIVDKLTSSPGGFLGYVKEFDDNAHSVKYNGITFYNPHYVVAFDALP